MIKKRRRTRASGERPPSLPELRAKEKKAIAQIIREHRGVLVKFKYIMESALAKAKVSTFVRLKRRKDFCDGFLLHEGKYAGG